MLLVSLNQLNVTSQFVFSQKQLSQSTGYAIAAPSQYREKLE
ncbi:MAG: hypothetical protein ACKO2V_17065 [Snowella sp.]